MSDGPRIGAPVGPLGGGRDAPGLFDIQSECDRPLCQRTCFGDYCQRHKPTNIFDSERDRRPSEGGTLLQSRPSPPAGDIAVCTDCAEYLTETAYEYCPFCGAELLAVTEADR